MLDKQKWDKINRALALTEKDTCRQVALIKKEICKQHRWCKVVLQY